MNSASSVEFFKWFYYLVTMIENTSNMCHLQTSGTFATYSTSLLQTSKAPLVQEGNILTNPASFDKPGFTLSAQTKQPISDH